MEEKISFTKTKNLQKGADSMMCSIAVDMILTIMSVILVTSITPTRKLSITEIAVLPDQNAEILRYCSKFDVVPVFPDIPEVVGSEMAAGLSS